jgi:ATP-dependent exoDNAse (exonuclease V) beta subunit
LFAPLLDHAGLLTPYDIVQEIFRYWGVFDRHPQAAGFLLRFLEVLHDAEQTGLADLAGFLDHWKKHGRKERAPLPVSMDAVSIMTIHKAKGLQFDVVLVPWHNFPIRAKKEICFWENGEGLAVLAPFSAGMGEPYSRAVADSASEAVHLLYVAWTRAVSELHCFLPEGKNGRMAAALNELLSGVPEAELEAAERPAPLPPEEEENRGPLPAPPESVPLPAETRLPDPPPAEAAAEPDSSAAGGEWRPMEWLPRLRIFRSPLEDWTSSARRRGAFLHRCLECLRLTGDPRADAVAAVNRGLAGFPLSTPDKEALVEQAIAGLAWYAGLPESAGWLAGGTPEQALLDEDGRVRRVDLLADDGQKLTAVEYKSGTSGGLPSPAHLEQLNGYILLLRQASGRPAGGALVYLDRREYFLYGEHP